jgi:hypothetical protein
LHLPGAAAALLLVLTKLTVVYHQPLVREHIVTLLGCAGLQCQAESLGFNLSSLLTEVDAERLLSFVSAGLGGFEVGSDGMA